VTAPESDTLHFELDLPTRTVPARPVVAPASPVAIELAFDPRSAFGGAVRAGFSASELVTAGAGGVPLVRRADARAMAPSIDDVEADAKLLADHGGAPTHWLMTAPYAWRVLRRQRVLRQALGVRREEASRARFEVEDALVAFAESALGAAERDPGYADAIDGLRRAEEVLRSRDRVLADENDAHSARLASVDARIAKLEAEREQTRADERNAAAQLATAQAELARAEAGLKRAESELHRAQQRESARGKE
jgi:hypothetical protein